MKIALFATPDNGPYVWVAVHDLSVNEGCYRQFRPIHALTFLAQFKAQERNRQKAFYLGMALENKLFGVRYFMSQLQEVVTPVSENVYQGHHVAEYAPQQRVIATLEAYLNSIYSALEIVSQLNRTFHPDLKQGFRRQSERFDLFSFERWEWLPYFFDLRSELAHFNTPIPSVQAQKIILEFTNPKDLEVFKKGRYEIAIEGICSYVSSLFDMLDAWAISELQSIDPEIEVDVAFEQGWKKPLQNKKVKVREILEQFIPAQPIISPTQP